jgi:hypothetical protein
MYGDVQFTFFIQRFSKDKSYQDGPHDQEEECFWDSVGNTQVKFLWFSILALGVLQLSFMWCLMIFQLSTTVSSIERETEPPEHWAELCLENSTNVMVDMPPEYVNDDWLTEGELELKLRHQNHDEVIGKATEQQHAGPGFAHPPRESSDNTSAEVPFDTSPTTDVEPERASNQVDPVTSTARISTPESMPLNPSTGPQLWRSTRINTGKFLPRYEHEYAFLSRLEDYSEESNFSQLAYMAELQTDWEDVIVNI